MVSNLIMYTPLRYFPGYRHWCRM